jgi:4-amino-4-deoxy-L-arabinose transferase-like glycosyltransferase
MQSLRRLFSSLFALFPAPLRTQAWAGNPPYAIPGWPGSGRQVLAMPLDWGWLALLAIVGAYLLPGLIGHDPWKQDETYIFGIIHQMLSTGDWVVPTMAGEPFMEKPPLYYWVAALSARSFAHWLPLHDGARLATGLFMALTCTAAGWTARQWWGKGHGRFAVLALLGSLGLVFHGHLMITDVPLLTGFAVATAGFVHARRRVWLSAALLGTGTGMAFMAKGVLGLGVFGLTALLLPVLFRQWRDRVYLRTLGMAALFASPWLLIWPVALYLRSYQLFMDWFWLNNIGRFFGFSVAQLGAPHTEGFWISTLPWFTFPALPLAAYTLWLRRQDLLRNSPVQVCTLVFGIMLAVLWTAASARDNYALPLLLPLALVAAPAVRRLPAWLDLGFDWSARLLFGAVIVMLWLVWGSMLYRGAPPEWEWLLRVLPREYAAVADWGNLLVAAVLTLLALAAMGQVHQAGRGLLSWVCGLGLCWLLISTLWLPWIDHAKSYRGVFKAMRQHLPQGYDCMASFNLGESERAMLQYFAGITTHRQESEPDANCELLLVNGLVSDLPEQLDSRHWNLIWEGARPGDYRERLWLFSARPEAGNASYYYD